MQIMALLLDNPNPIISINNFSTWFAISNCTILTHRCSEVHDELGVRNVLSEEILIRSSKVNFETSERNQFDEIGISILLSGQGRHSLSNN